MRELERELSLGEQRNSLVAAYHAIRIAHDNNAREQLRSQWEDGP